MSKAQNLKIMQVYIPKIMKFPKVNVDNTKIAVCTYCKSQGNIESGNLAFLELAATRAKDICKHCGYAPMAHTPEVRCREHLARVMGDGHKFESVNPEEINSLYYCGCRGWN
jgi:hypothetical protein